MWEVANKKKKSRAYHNPHLWKITSIFLLFFSVFLLNLLSNGAHVSVRSPPLQMPLHPKRKCRVAAPRFHLFFFSRRRIFVHLLILLPWQVSFNHRLSVSANLITTWSELRSQTKYIIPSSHVHVLWKHKKFDFVTALWTHLPGKRFFFFFFPSDNNKKFFIDSSGEFVKLNFPDFLQSGTLKKILHNAPEITWPALTFCARPAVSLIFTVPLLKQRRKF